MTSALVKAALFAILSSLPQVAFANADPPMDYTGFFSKSRDHLEDLNNRRDELDKKISKCEDTVPGKLARWCKNENGRSVTMMNSDYNAIKKESEDLSAQISQMQRETNRANEAKARSEAAQKADATFKKYTEDMKALLASKKDFDRDLKMSGIEIKAIYAKLDQSVVGDYAKYVAREYSKSNEMKSTICKAVTSCGEVSKLKSEVSNMNVKIKSFDDFAAEIRGKAVEVAKPAVEVTK